MGFIVGQQLLCMEPGPCKWGLVDFVGNDEGWCRISENGYERTVRPSYLRPLNERTLQIVLNNFESALGEASQSEIAFARNIAVQVADAIRFWPERLKELQRRETKSVQG